MSEIFSLHVDSRRNRLYSLSLYLSISILLLVIILSMISSPHYGSIIILSGIVSAIAFLSYYRISAVEIEDGTIYLLNLRKRRIKKFKLCDIELPVLLLQKDYFEVYMHFNMPVALKFVEEKGTEYFRTMTEYNARDAIELQNWLIGEIRKHCPLTRYSEVKEYETLPEVPTAKYNLPKWKTDTITLFIAYFLIYFSFWAALYIIFGPVVSFLPLIVIALLYLLKLLDLKQQKQISPLTLEVKELSETEWLETEPIAKMTNYRKKLFSLMALISGLYLSLSLFLLSFILIFSVFFTFSIYAVIFSIFWLITFMTLGKNTPKTVYFLDQGVVFEYKAKAPRETSSLSNKRKNNFHGLFLKWEDINSVEIKEGKIMVHPILKLKNGKFLLLETLDRNITLNLLVKLEKRGVKRNKLDNWRKKPQTSFLKS